MILRSLRIEELEARCAPVTLPVQAALVAAERVARLNGDVELSTLSLVQKSKHDAAMAAIQNTR